MVQNRLKKRKKYDTSQKKKKSYAINITAAEKKTGQSCYDGHGQG